MRVREEEMQKWEESARNSELKNRRWELETSNSQRGEEEEGKEKMETYNFLKTKFRVSIFHCSNVYILKA